MRSISIDLINKKIYYIFTPVIPIEQSKHDSQIASNLRDYLMIITRKPVIQRPLFIVEDDLLKTLGYIFRVNGGELNKYDKEHLNRRMFRRITKELYPNDKRNSKKK